MLDLSAAKAIALSVLQKPGSPEIAIVDEKTLETKVGWVFFYNARQYLETGNVECTLYGNVPLLIDKCDGSSHFIGVQISIETYLQDYEQHHNLKC